VANEESNGNNVALRPLIARLKEIERKCDSMGTRNEEFPLMKDRLARIISRLEAGEEPSGEPLSYRNLARDLFPVAHLFESVGFMSVGKEIAHVERSLKDLEPEPSSTVRTESPAGPSPTSSAAVAQPAESSEAEPGRDDDTEEESAGEGVPKPVIGAFLILVIAIAVAATIVYRVRPPGGELQPTPPPVTPTVPPRPTQGSSPASVTSEPDLATNAPERLADALEQASTAVSEGDVDGAVGYLAFAELIDRNDPRVEQLADRIVDQLVERADQAATEERWDEAASFTAQARTVASRFGLDTGRISDAENRHFELQQYRVVSPEEIQVLRASIGKHVDVMLRDGSRFAGWLTGFKGSTMILDVEDDVGGGIVSFTDEIALDTIEWIRIRED
jgi:hypothetical protein